MGPTMTGVIDMFLFLAARLGSDTVRAINTPYNVSGFGGL